MKSRIRNIGQGIRDWARHYDGATAIEYSLVAAGIALAIAAVVFGLGDKIYDLMYSGLPDAFDN